MVSKQDTRTMFPGLPTPPTPDPPPGSRDGVGSGDHDQPFRFGAPCMLSLRQRARLLVVRGRAMDDRREREDAARDLAG